MSFTGPCGDPVFFRTYSRVKENGTKENWLEVVERTIEGLPGVELIPSKVVEELKDLQRSVKFTTAGRWLWIGGTGYIESTGSTMAAFNCVSLSIDSWKDIVRNFEFLLNGSGVGTSVELSNLSKLRPVVNELELSIIGEFGSKPSIESTTIDINSTTDIVTIVVGDSREGWVKAYEHLINLATMYYPDSIASEAFHVVLDISHIRKAGTRIKGFGGTAQPGRLPDMFIVTTKLLNSLAGKVIDSLTICKILGEAGLCVMVGGVRRSARINLGSPEDELFTASKDNLWVQNAEGKWVVDPERNSLRMANHTRVYHTKPSLEVIHEAVTKQYHSGEGAIMYAPEAIARCNADVLPTREDKNTFISKYNESPSAAQVYLNSLVPNASAYELEHRIGRYLGNPCFEVLGKDFVCSLSMVHLENIDPTNRDEQERVFRAAAIANTCLLRLQFKDEKMQRSRELDPIVQVTFTGLFDFLVKAMGEDWLAWWMAGRPLDWVGTTYTAEQMLARESEHLNLWREVVEATVAEYSKLLGVPKPNRTTGVQPSGSKSLLSGGAPGWHPPKSQYYTRRITFSKNDPVALACIDYGYKVVPSQNDKDESGALLDDPFDERVSDWLVEIPCCCPWVDTVSGEWSIEKAPVNSQWSLYMQVQKHYSTFNVSSTIELEESEIDALSRLMWEAIELDEGYVSTALLAKFDAPFPRLPFEKIHKEAYDLAMAEVKARRTSTTDFHELVNRYVNEDGVGEAGCESGFCEAPNKSDAKVVFSGF